MKRIEILSWSFIIIKLCRHNWRIYYFEERHLSRNEYIFFQKSNSSFHVKWSILRKKLGGNLSRLVTRFVPRPGISRTRSYVPVSLSSSSKEDGKSMLWDFCFHKRGMKVNYMHDEYLWKLKSSTHPWHFLLRIY